MEPNQRFFGVKMYLKYPLFNWKDSISKLGVGYASFLLLQVQVQRQLRHHHMKQMII
jgi:hypothetical protein